jgi:hypothetical protein
MAFEKTIYVHIGTPKTGTTSIQNYLADNYDSLLKKGFLVPVTSRKKKPNHTLLALYCINRKRITAISIRNDIHDEKSLRKFRRRFRWDFRSEIKNFNGSAVVVSNEQCYGRLTTIGELQKLRKLFRGLQADVKIIVYLREQTDMVCSYYSSNIKSGKTHLIHNQDEFRENDFFDYNKTLKKWEEVFGIKNIIVRIFDSEGLKNNDIISDFMEVVGMDEIAYAPIRVNTKLNVKQCEFLRIINEHIPLISGNRMNTNRAGLVKMVESLSVESPGLSVLIDSSYQRLHEEGNKEIAKRYFNGKPDIFRKKKLNDRAMSQTELLSLEDCKIMADEIIFRFGDSHEVLCKCIAAIFKVKYRGEHIPMAYVDSLGMSREPAEVEGKPSVFRVIYRKVRGLARKIFA